MILKCLRLGGQRQCFGAPWRQEPSFFSLLSVAGSEFWSASAPNAIKHLQKNSWLFEIGRWVKICFPHLATSCWPLFDYTHLLTSCWPLYSIVAASCWPLHCCILLLTSALLQPPADLCIVASSCWPLYCCSLLLTAVLLQPPADLACWNCIVAASYWPLYCCILLLTSVLLHPPASLCIVATSCWPL